MANNLLSTVQLIEQANVVLSKHAELLSQAAIDAEKLNKAYAKIPSKFIKAQETQLKNQTKLTASTKALNTQTNKITTSYKQAIPSLTALVNQRKREQRLLEKTSGLYNRVQQAINKVTKTYQDLALKKKLGGNLSKKEETQLTRLQGKLLKYNNALKQVDAQVGKNQRNVGNYSSAMKGLAISFRAVASAFGLSSGIFIFAGAVKDAFNRIKEFDKAMQNIAGIMRVSRSEIKDLETEIINVASSSIKTSREVASLAENLVTLGKTKSEIKDLLKPVNDLAIGLETTSGEAAEFLVQTLNAFGAGSDEAAKYADVIATIRTSTTLDFQKMRDSFQYITPISRILNKDLAYTGAIVGVLADNGLKAEQSGRLLGTAIQKLAVDNISLEDGLQRINDAQARGVKETELLALASDLFGKQAAKVGIVLANNSDIIDKNAQAIRENTGALDDLTNEQLKSLDAQLKILDSTWEKFILSIENGDNALSYVLGTFIKLTAAAIAFQTLLLTAQTASEWTISKMYRSTLKLIKGNKESIETVKSMIVIQTKRLAQLKTAEKFDNLSNKQLKENNKEQLKTIGVLKALREYEANYIEVKTKKKKLIEETTKAKKESNEEDKVEFDFMADTIPYYEAIISSLEEQQKAVASNKELWDFYQVSIDRAKLSLEELRKELGLVTDEVEDSSNIFQDGTWIQPDPNATGNWKQTFQTITDLGRRAFGIIAELSNASFERQYADLEAQKENAIAFAGESAVARANIEEQYDRKRKKIQEQEAEAKKEQAIFDITLDTASAVVRALPNIPLSIAMGVLGAAQLALVASRQVPAFWRGGEVGGSQQIMVNDDPYGKKGANYKEVIEKPNGQILTPQGRNVKMTVPKGSFVHPTYDAFMNSLDSELLGNNIMPIGANTIMPMIINNGLTKGEVLEVMHDQTSRVVSTINNQHGININIDEHGINKYIKKKGGTSKIMNARYSGRGISV